MPPRISFPVIVGRDTDLATIARAIEASAAGSPRFVVIRGEAGIGKSREVSEAAAAGRAGTP